MSVFERTEMLLGREAVEKLKNCTVAVFGVGGVGGHCAEALARSGVGKLVLIDGDTVAESNLNRQIIASRKTLGMPKTQAAAEHILEIIPECEVECRQVFVLPELLESWDFSEFDYVVDAIDTVSAKLTIAKICDKLGIPAISAMGAGNKLDPTKFEVTDIYKTSVCPLASVMRRELRKAGVAKLKVVYSREPALRPEFQPSDEDEVLENKETDTMEENTGNPFRKKTTPASCAFVPAAAGLIMAGEVIRDLCAGELARSLENRGK